MKERKEQLELQQKEQAVEEAIAKLRELGKNRDAVIAGWQVLHTPELDAALERRRQWEILSLAKAGQKILM